MADRKLVGELNRLQRELRDDQKRLEKMEAHEGEDGIPEDIDGQLLLIEQMRVKQLRVRELRKVVYP